VTALPGSGPGSASSAERAPLGLIVISVVLLVALLGTVSYVAYSMATQPRYDSPGQAEIDARRAAVREAPRDLAALLELAYAYQRAGRYDDALSAYDDVLDMVPIETAALYNKGVILLELGDEDAAEEALLAALAVNDGHVLSAKALGELYARQERYEAVLDVVLPALERSPSAADLHYLAGLAHENLGDADQAERRYRLALEYYPDLREAREALERLGVNP
jgi:tetratricopeptide (TPR) repeat protein